MKEILKHHIDHDIIISDEESDKFITICQEHDIIILPNELLQKAIQILQKMLNEKEI